MNLLSCCCVLLLLGSLTSVSGFSSGITVEDDGAYDGITVKIEETVPRHLCFRLLDRLEVSYFFIDVFWILI